jgi:Asp-tRNA(Asn)/Glu-tRNA(Gln) amidotransferase A subunit family amidase
MKPESNRCHSLGCRIALPALLTLSACAPADYFVAADSFILPEATIASVHNALRMEQITCRELVQSYLDRIEQSDQSSGLNAIARGNPRAIERATELDAEFERERRLRPLHCVPVIVKENYDTADLPTTAGSIALKDSLPPDDSYQVRKLREAGAIVLAKSHMAEWAFSPYETVSSLGGITRNPYDLSRVPAGSSGGTAAAVAANFGLVGLGTDTGNSIRGPSGHTSLVGLRPTLGLTSRDGIVPLDLSRDIGGPMTRTVEDAAKVLQAIAGYDPADPLTAASRDKVPPDYTRFLDRNGLRGARLGVLRALADPQASDPEILSLFEAAIQDLEKQGALLVDPFDIPDFENLREDLWCDRFRYDVERYLQSLGPRVPLKTLQEIIESGDFHPSIEERLRNQLSVVGNPAEQNPPCLGVEENPRRRALRDAVREAMAAADVAALVYPTWAYPARPVGDLESPHGNNSPVIAPHTGQPAITVPMGFTTPAGGAAQGLPAGLQILGREFGEPDLLGFAYAYEQATRRRTPPRGF